MLYNISFDICAGVITLITLYTMVFRRDPGRFSNRVFLLMQLGTFPTMKKWQPALVWMPEILMILLPLALNPAFRCWCKAS